MDKLQIVLNTLRIKFREILSHSEDSMHIWDIRSLQSIGEQLVRLAFEFYAELAEVEHKILYQSLREAGLGIRHRAMIIQKRMILKDDKEYFKNVFVALESICKNMETGEYYNALMAITNRIQSLNDASKTPIC